MKDFEAWIEDSFSKIASKWGKVLGVEPDVGGKKHLNKGRDCVLTKDCCWINEVVKVKVKSKFVKVRVIENMEFNVDVNPVPSEEDRSSWVSETSLDQSSTGSSLEDEQFGGEDEEFMGFSFETNSNSKMSLIMAVPRVKNMFWLNNDH